MIKGQYLNLIMEYIPEPLSRIVKSNLPYKKYLPIPTVIAWSKCLLKALADLHVAVKIDRNSTFAIEISNLPISWWNKRWPNCVTSDRPRSSPLDRKILPTSAQGTTEPQNSS